MSQADFVLDVLTDLRNQISNQGYLWAGQRNEVLDSLLAHLRDAPPETVIEFTLTALRLVLQEQGWLSHVLNQALGTVLRRNLPFTEDQVVEMLELVSVPHQSLPFKGVLKAAEALPVTPRKAFRGSSRK